MTAEDIERLTRECADLRDRIAKLEDAVARILGPWGAGLPLFETMNNIVVPTEREA